MINMEKVFNFLSGQHDVSSSLFIFIIIGLGLCALVICALVIVWLVKLVARNDVQRKEKISREVEKINNLLSSGKITVEEASDLKQSLGAAALPSQNIQDKSANTWAMACHLISLVGYVTLVVGIPLSHIIAPLILWLIKRNDSPFIDEQGKESLNFQISCLLYYFVLVVLMILAIFLCLILIGIPLLLLFVACFVVLLILQFICPIVAAIRTSSGQSYRYPLTIRFFS
jgi:uncharacterized protein